MTKSTAGKLICGMIFGLCLIFTGIHDGTAAELAKKRVLFISSYSYSWETVPSQIEGIQEAFGEEVSIDYKFMDTKNVRSQVGEQLFYQSLKQFLYEVRPYDGVIVGDDAAFQFIVKYRQELFPDVPIAFEGVNDGETAREAAKNDTLISGVLEGLSYNETLALACRLYPDAKKIIAIMDDSITAQSERASFSRISRHYPDRVFSEINASAYTKDELAQHLEQLDTNTILLYVMCSHDKYGNTYTSSEAIEWLSSHAPVPLFSIVSVGMGDGVLGGEIVSQKQMGYLAADMLLQEFADSDGDMGTIIQNSPREFCFDENIMRQYGIKESQLPKGSTIINHRETFWERNQKAIFICTACVTVLLIIITRLMFDKRKQKEMVNTLRQAKVNFENEARYDMLTGLKNRTVFYQELQQRIDKNKKFGMLLFDIDGFKNINDTLGHNNGDVVLKELARRCSKMENGLFKVYRLAGDEFTAVVEVTDDEMAKNYARMIKASFKDPFILDGKEYLLHSSIGVAMHPQDGTNANDIIDAADTAMYYVKNHGKNNVAFYRDIAVESENEGSSKS